ncbi:hypothetical protein MKS88_005181 [Plasmodium brasilianum]|uniref:Dynein light chain n=3 Tax=Plasmodium (Plasmodium) TaxID=418103 RepID=A0A1D3TDD9_PLAMA|nr:conserved Plasmodium protein, unknown function [Plasmodium malariae]KAI4835962.1 hypothetical protein MKS88_005181 [Plasmodium brasilianum]SCP02901.1 conserved Plasmodium protein, unknown function [Plasmodium malariae]
MEKNHNILKYGNFFNVSKELKSYMLKAMKEYQCYFEKALIKNCNLEDNIKLVKDLIIDEETCYNEDIFLKIQKTFHIYDFFNLSLLFPMKIINKNGKTLVQLISEDTNQNDLELIQAVLTNIEQNKMDKLNFFYIENIIFELLDEIIRQITVECPKRGFALTLINNEIQKNINYYKNLIEIIEHNNDMNNEKFKEVQSKRNLLLGQLAAEEDKLKEKLTDVQNELELLKNENKKKMQENKNKKEIQYDLLKHNESLLEKIKEIYDKQGEI